MADTLIHEIPTTDTSFASDDYIVLDGVTNGTRNMTQANLKNSVIAGNIAPLFDPTKTSSDAYAIGDDVIYDGEWYSFKATHYGAWDASHVNRNGSYSDYVNHLASASSLEATDVITVTNSTDGTRKMSKDTLLQLTAQNALAGNIAPAFSTETAYAVDDLVTYQGQLYRCKVAHSAGAWASAHFQATTFKDEVARNTELADVINAITSQFSATTACVAGKLYWYEGDLYKCNTAYTGAWDSTKFVKFSMSDGFLLLNALTTILLESSALPLTNYVSKYISNTGREVSDANNALFTDYIYLPNGCKNVCLTCDVLPTALSVAFYTDTTFISRTLFQSFDSTLNIVNIAEVPPNATRLRFWMSAPNAVESIEYYSPKIYVTSSINTILSTLSELQQFSDIVKVIATPSSVHYDWTQGLINANGTISSSTKNYYSRIFQNTELDYIKVTALEAEYLVAFAVYDDNGNFVQRIDWRNSLVSTGNNIRIILYTPTADESIQDVLNKFNITPYKIGSDKQNNDIVERACHISYDDYVGWVDFIINENVYTSIYDNDFISYLKSLHDDYGAVFTLNCFCTSESYSISDVPSKFASEFSAAHDWLKFAFHSENASTTYSTDKVAQITSSYNAFVTAIYKMTGDIRCIDRVTRTQSFTGTINNVKAIRDCSCGVIGLFTSQDIRQNYYLSNDDNTYAYNHLLLKDATTYLTFIKSQYDIGSGMQTSIPSDVLDPSNGNVVSFLELYLHYQVRTSSKDSVNNWIIFLKTNDFKFTFPMYYFRLV